MARDPRRPAQDTWREDHRLRISNLRVAAEYVGVPEWTVAGGKALGEKLDLRHERGLGVPRNGDATRQPRPAEQEPASQERGEDGQQGPFRAVGWFAEAIEPGVSGMSVHGTAGLAFGLPSTPPSIAPAVRSSRWHLPAAERRNWTDPQPRESLRRGRHTSPTRGSRTLRKSSGAPRSDPAHHPGARGQAVRRRPTWSDARRAHRNRGGGEPLDQPRSGARPPAPASRGGRCRDGRRWDSDRRRSASRRAPRGRPQSSACRH